VYKNIASGLRFRGYPAGEIQTRVEKWMERLTFHTFPDAGRRVYRVVKLKGSAWRELFAWKPS